MKDLLIINVNIVGNSPQPIRIRNLVHHWQESANITLVTMNNYDDEDLFPGENVHVVKTPYSAIGKVIISKNIIASKEYIDAKKKTLKRRIREVVRKIWRASIFYRMMFPDKFIFEHHKILNEARKLKKSGKNFELVIISAAPFSLLRLGRKMKKIFPGAFRIYDTGDPFYGNTTLLLIKPFRTFFARNFEKKHLKDFDLIVVPTQILKEHYIRHFEKTVVPSQIRVIEQGVEQIFSGVLPKSGIDRNKLKLLYAGGLYKNLREPFELYHAVRDYAPGMVTLRIFGNIYKDFLPEQKDNFYYGGSISSEQLLAEYNACDVTVFIDNLSGIQIPGKVLELLSIRRPILFIYGNPDSPTLNMVKNNKRIVMCENTTASIMKGFDYLLDHYSSFNYDDMPEEYFWPSLADKYLEGYL